MMDSSSNSWHRLVVVVWTALVATTTIATTVAAQEVVAPDEFDESTAFGSETVDQTGDDDDDDEDDEDQSQFDSFDDMNVERIRPDEIPDFHPGLPRGAQTRMDTSDLPRSLSGEQMRKVSHHVASSTVEIVAVQTPPRPYRPTKMIYRGHALWVSPSESGADPVLLTTADWIEEADEIYAVDADASQALSEGGLQLGGPEPQPLEDFTADATDLLERHRSDLIELQVDGADQHVNLAKLDGAEGVDIATPEAGLVLHDMSAVMPGTIFGYSPAIDMTVMPVGYVDSEGLEEAYSFYFMVDFSAILGAPIVGPTGRLIGITALRHPEEPEQTLAIPPGAIHAFLGTGRAKPEDDDDS